LILFLISACDDGSKKTGDSEEKYYLPDAGGNIGEMLVLMDSAKWQGELGKVVRQTFAASVPGLPQDEAYYDLKYISPRKFNSVLKFAKNVMIVMTLESNSPDSRALRKDFTAQSLNRINSEPDLFMTTRTDEFARGQEILYLFSKDEESLISKIKENQNRLVSHFNKIESDRIANKIFSRRELNIEKRLMEDQKFSFKIPEGYDLAKNLPNFVWLRFLDLEYEKNVFVYHEPYTSDELFKTKDITAFREKITGTLMRDAEKPEIYMTYQPELDFEVKEINFKGKFALETRGLWKLSDISGGGPFVSYTFVDQELNRLYYVEAYVFAPSKDKFPLMREMNTILKSFQMESELKAATASSTP
ncbi:MAG: DUF4837 family protein, partial [Cyclobacteriaceae bacterium]